MTQAQNVAELSSDINSSGVLQVVGGGTGTTTSTGTGSVVLSTNPTFAGLTDSGNLTFTGTGNRITGDFSNATIASRAAFQTSTVNSSSVLTVLPNGTGAASQLVLSNNSDPTNAQICQLLVNASEFRINSTAYGTGTGTYLPLTMYTGGSERLRIDTSGNVGIGTSSPSGWNGRTLSVASSTNDAGIRFDGNLGSWGIGGGGTATGSNSLRFYNFTSSSEAMRIDSSGNVGIGTASPDTKLSVLGTSVRFTQSTYVSGTTGSGLLIDYAAGYTRLSSYINGFANWGNLILQEAGNVGIGTTSPASKLHVSGSGFFTDRTIPTSGSGLEINGGATTGITAVNRTTSAFLQLDIYTGFTTFFTGGAERMRIDSSGNVGIGTSSPAVKLHVSGGTQRIQSTGSTSDAFLTLQNDVGTQAVLGIGSSGNSPANSFYVQTNAGKSLVISAAGNVGIGTTGPGEQLSVAGAANVYGSWLSTGGVKTQIFSSDATGGGGLGTVSNTFMALYTNNTERFRIGSAGQLGVGGANYGTSGQVLTSGGSGAAPSWATVSGLGNTSQVWTDVTASRSSGTTYTNSTGAPIIFVFYGADNPNQGLSFSMTINGSSAISSGVHGSVGYPIQISFVIPNGKTYSASWNTSANVPGIWELR